MHICAYEVYICQYLRASELYPCIYTYICAYLCIYVYMLGNQSPGPISGSNLTGTNLRVQSPGPISDVHICAYVLISYNICVYQIYICAYICIFFIIWFYLIISVHICVYEVYIRQYLRVSELYPCIYTYICACLCIYVYMLRNQSPGPIFRSNLTRTNLRSNLRVQYQMFISVHMC